METESNRPGLVEEVLALLKTEGAFFDDALLQETLQERQREASYSLKFLGRVHQQRRRHRSDAPNCSTEKQRAAVTGRLAAELLIRLAFQHTRRIVEQSPQPNVRSCTSRRRSRSGPGERPDRPDGRSLPVDSEPRHGVRATLAKLQRSPRAREPEIHSEIEELRRILDERAKSGIASRPADARGARNPTDAQYRQRG